jgi:hypothetical protein
VGIIWVLPWRILIRAGRELEEVREKDPDGRIVYHHRTVDTLGKMLRAGTIDQAMHDAAKDLQAAFAPPVAPQRVLR